MPQQPMYQQIADDIRQQIENGELRRSKQLPTELELRKKYGASRNTVRDAIKLLAALGLVETRPGQGTFIRKRPDPFVTTLSADSMTGFGGGEGTIRLSALASVDPDLEQEPSASIPEVKVQTPDPWLRRRLGLSETDQVIARSQQRKIGNDPWSLQVTYYPMEFITRGATRLLANEDIQPGTVAYLAEAIDVKQTAYRDWIIARRPNDDEQAFFGVAPDSTILEVTRTAFDQDKKPFRVTVTAFPAEQNQFIYDFGDGLPEPHYDDRRPRGGS